LPTAVIHWSMRKVWRTVSWWDSMPHDGLAMAAAKEWNYSVRTPCIRIRCQGKSWGRGRVFLLFPIQWEPMTMRPLLRFSERRASMPAWTRCWSGNMPVWRMACGGAGNADTSSDVVGVHW